MSKVFKVAMSFIAVLTIAGVGTLPLVYSQYEDDSVMTMDILGEIVSVDLEKSSIVVKHVTDETMNVSEEVTLNVTDATEIMKGGNAATSKDLMAGDKVSVSYMKNADGNMEATSISVEE